MNLFLIFILAALMAATLQRMLGLAAVPGARPVFLCACLLPLGLCAYAALSLGGAAFVLLVLLLSVAGLFLAFHTLRGDALAHSAINFHDLRVLLLLIVPAAFAYLYLRVPVVSDVGSAGFLDLLKTYSLHGGIVFFPSNTESAAPHLGYALFALNAVGYVPGFGPLLFALFGLWLLYAVAAQFVSQHLAALATLAFACSPYFLNFATYPGFQSVLFCFLLAAALGLILAERYRHPALLVAAALACGGACGVSYLGYPFLFILLAAYLLQTRNWRGALIFLGIALLCAAPFLLRNVYYYGNPVYPYLYSWFGGGDGLSLTYPYFRNHDELGEGLLPFMQGMLRGPWQAAMQVQQVEAWRWSPGLFLVLFLVPALALGSVLQRKTFIFLLILGDFLNVFGADSLALAPIVAGLGIVAVGALEGFPQRMKPMAVALLWLALATGMFMQFVLLYVERDVILGRVSWADYLGQKIQAYPVYQLMYEHYNDGGAVLLLEPHGQHLEVPTVYSPEQIKNLAKKSEAEQFEWLRKQGVGYLLLPESLTPPKAVADMLTAWTSNRRTFALLETRQYKVKDTNSISRMYIYKVKI